MKDETYLRVEAVIKNCHQTVSGFEKEIGVSNGSVATAINRGSSFKSNVLNKILNRYPHFSAEWLLTGQGSMILDNGQMSNVLNDSGASYNTEELIKLVSNIVDDKIKKQADTISKLEAIVGYNIINNNLSVDGLEVEESSKESKQQKFTGD